MNMREHHHLAKSENRHSAAIVWLVTCISSVCAPAIAEEQKREVRDLEEVIVTAQKREQRLQDVPISVSVLGGGDLDQATAEGVTEALSRVPGIATSVAYQGGNTILTARGVSAGGPLYNGASPVGYYLDSAPFGLVKSTVVPDSNAYDLQRVEILRGPQGTLYGANALNGVVRVLTHDADPSKFDLKGRTMVSHTETGGENYRGDVSMNVPIVEDKLAARVTGGYQNMAGWIDRPSRKDANDAEIRTGRIKVNAQPTENLSVAMSAWLSRADFGAMSISGPDAFRDSSVEEPMSTDYEIYGLKIGYTHPRFSVSSMTGYIDYSNDGYLDLRPQNSPGTLFTGLDATMFSQEVVLNSTDEGLWRWSGGAIYRDAEDGVLQTYEEFLVTDVADLSESFAVFGELTRTFLDGRVELTGGLRYFEDDVKGIENRKGDFSADPLGTPIRRSGKFDAISPRAVLTWHAGDIATLYLSYSEGFRSGFNQSPVVLEVAPEFRSVKADTLNNYEIGAKGYLDDQRVYYEAAVYFIDWQEVQQTITVPGATNIPVTATVNGESASGAGVDLAIGAQVVDGLELSVNFSWNDLSMDEAVVSFPAEAPQGVILFDEGDRLSFSPEYTVGTSIDYGFQLGQTGLDCQWSASANYTSQQDWKNIINGARVVASGDSMLIARTSFSITSPNHWTTTIFVDNLNNEDGFPYRSPYGGFTDTRVRPRTSGVQVEYRW